MRLAFVNPPRIGRKKRAVEAEDCCWGLGPLVLPAMLLACASEAQRAGHDVAFVDLAIDKPQALPDFALDAVVHALAWQWHGIVNKAMAEACGNVPRVVLAVPPGYAKRYAELDPAPLFALHSEPERGMHPLPGKGTGFTDWLPHTCTLAGIQVEMPDNSLDQLGAVDYTLVPTHYWQHYAAAIYQVTRGCPYRCSFCVWGGSTVTDPTFKMRPAQQVADDIGQIRRLSVEARGKPIPLYLLCAQLTTNEKWIADFERAMQGVPYPFQANVNLGDLTADKLRVLMKCGLVSTSIGLEAVTTPLLGMLGKPYTFERAVHGLLTLQEVGINWKAHVRYGFGETAEDVAEATANLLKMKGAGLRNPRIDFAPIVHYEGTRIREEATYELGPLPGSEVERLAMADPPDWSPFVDRLREYGWLKSVGPRK